MRTQAPTSSVASGYDSIFHSRTLFLFRYMSFNLIFMVPRASGTIPEALNSLRPLVFEPASRYVSVVHLARFAH